MNKLIELILSTEMCGMININKKEPNYDTYERQPLTFIKDSNGHSNNKTIDFPSYTGKEIFTVTHITLYDEDGSLITGIELYRPVDIINGDRLTLNKGDITFE